jgi:hypothetical protein
MLFPTPGMQCCGADSSTVTLSAYAVVGVSSTTHHRHYRVLAFLLDANQPEFCATLGNCMES